MAKSAFMNLDYVMNFISIQKLEILEQLIHHNNNNS